MNAKRRKHSSKPGKALPQGRATLAKLRSVSEREIEETSPPELANLPKDFWVGAAVMPKRDIVQIENPRTGRYVKIDRSEGRILDHKKSDGPYKGVPVAKRSAPRTWGEPEYDFSKGARGVTAKRYAAGTNIVLLDPDVLAAFPTSAAVNTALRAVMRTKSRAGATRKRTKRKA